VIPSQWLPRWLRQIQQRVAATFRLHNGIAAGGDSAGQRNRKAGGGGFRGGEIRAEYLRAARQYGIASAGVVVARLDCILVGTSSNQVALADEGRDLVR